LLSGDGGGLLRKKGGTDHAFGAIRVDAFPSGGNFKQLMDDMIEKLHKAPTVPGVDKILYPGERENLIAEERSRNGIPLHPKVIEELETMSRDLHLRMDIW
jgi:LDH2 family malate/lactate/ureidoglycolate dehydrogenase